MLTVTGYVARQPYKVMVDDGAVLTPDKLAGDADVLFVLACSSGTSWPPTPTSARVPFDLADPLSVAAALVGQTTVSSIDGVVLAEPVGEDCIA